MTISQLLPKEVRNRLPKYEELPETTEELIVQAKFFYPDFSWTWYAIAFDGDDIFYGLVDGFEREFGDFRLSELLANRGKFGCAIERDLYFTPKPVGELMRSEHA
jgi:hypothetical protein